MSTDTTERKNSAVRVGELLRVVDYFGAMHIVVEDGNVEDRDLDFVEAEMAKAAPIAEEIELLALLRAMTVSERDIIFNPFDHETQD